MPQVSLSDKVQKMKVHELKAIIVFTFVFILHHSEWEGKFSDMYFVLDHQGMFIKSLYFKIKDYDILFQFT